MKEYVRTLSARTEFIIVILGAFGLFLPSNLQALLAALGGFLKTRGWTTQRIGLTPSLHDSAIGLGLAALVYVTSPIIWTVAANIAPNIVLAATSTPLVGAQLDLTAIIGVSVINPVFEEVFVCGYLITALKEKRSVAFAANVSAGLRIAYHLYQGAAGVLSIAPTGLLFAYWYARTGRLWPLIVAHAVMDLTGLVIYGGG